MGKCTKVKFNGSYNTGYDENADYFDKGMLIFDNSITPTQTNVTNGIYNYDPSNNVVCLDNITINSLHGTIISTSTPENTKARFLYPLNSTSIGGIAGSGYNAVKGNFKLRMKDVVRCQNLESFFPSGNAMIDSYNIERLGVLTKLSNIRLNGGFAYLWNGDLVNLADAQIDNGRDVISYPVLIMRCSTGFNPSKMLVNGHGIDTSSGDMFYHVVFGASGYSIYRTNSSTPLADYSGLTPVYTK